jgi:hypothetical protein
MRRNTSRVRPALFVAAIAASIVTATLVAAPATPSSSQAASDTVSRFLESGQPPLKAYRARRHLEASSRAGKMKAQLDAQTTLLPDGAFSFEVLNESGSNLLRQRILRAALLEEQDNHNSAKLAESDFTRENYDFLVQESTRDSDLVRISLAPRRRSQLLIDGAAFVRRDDADLVRIQGVLSKRPSFWTRKVEITRHYARVDGVRVPIEVRLDADVLLVGDSAFDMTYQYLAINGRPIATN